MSQLDSMTLQARHRGRQMLFNFTDTDPSVQFSHPVSSDALLPHGLQHASLPCSSPIPSAQSLLKPLSIELVMPSNHLVLCRPLLPLPLIFPGIKAKINALEKFPVSCEPASFVLNTLILPNYSSGPPAHAAARALGAETLVQ